CIPWALCSWGTPVAVSWLSGIQGNQHPAVMQAQVLEFNAAAQPVGTTVADADKGLAPPQELAFAALLLQAHAPMQMARQLFLRPQRQLHVSQHAFAVKPLRQQWRAGSGHRPLRQTGGKQRAAYVAESH